MKSHFSIALGATAGIFCLMMFAQTTHAQSGSRSGQYQAPQQRAPSAIVQGDYGAAQGSGQRVSPQNSQPRQAARIGFDQYDHRPLDALLQKYVDERGDVDYATWQTNQQDRASLMSYLQGMGSIDTSLRSSQQSQMAFWINAYNALTIEGILQLFPTRSIKDHAPNANGYNIWDDFKMPVGGSEYSLNDMEHKVLRKMGDARIHFAIVCASKGCPQLSQRAYFPDSLDQQLTSSASLFFNTPGKFSYDVQRRQLGLSPIIQWFGEDFGRTDQERLQYLSQFMPADARQLAISGSPSISYLDYDWNLNLAPRRAATSVQALRPPGSATRQLSPGQNPSGQGAATQGSATRRQVETVLPGQPIQGGQSPCPSAGSQGQGFGFQPGR